MDLTDALALFTTNIDAVVTFVTGLITAALTPALVIAAFYVGYRWVRGFVRA